MQSLGPRFFLFLLLAAAAIALACGSSNSNHLLQSVSLSPATASGSEVQFTATGFFNTMPSPVTPFTASWGACNLDGSTTTAVTVSASGLAQCTASSGSYNVWAYGSNPANGTCGAINACGGGCGRVTGTAQLTCP
jgi:hypothetical protein